MTYPEGPSRVTISNRPLNSRGAEENESLHNNYGRNMLRYWTAGDSHGKTLIALVDGFPAGVPLDAEPINVELKRRQGGYGRGGRQRIETDFVDILSGIWHGTSLGSPIAL